LATSQNTLLVLLTVSILLSAFAVAFTSYAVWSKPTASITQTTVATETLAVVGTGKATGQFDQLVITVSAQAANNTLVEATQTIQNRMAAASKLFATSGLSVQTTVAPSLTVGTTYISGTTSQIEVSQTVIFTISNVSSSDINASEKAVGIVDESGLATLPQGTYSSDVVQIGYQYSPSLQNKLELEAYQGAIQNATENADAIAAGEGLKVTGIVQISEVSPATFTQSASLLSLYVLLGLGYPTPMVQVDVQVTFAVQSA
jgi:uncharacterized protein YggE